MKKLITTSFLLAFAVAMLLPVVMQVNAATVNQSVLRQGGNPIPPNGGGHFTARQGGNPIPPNGGGHFTARQGGNPIPPNGGGH